MSYIRSNHDHVLDTINNINNIKQREFSTIFGFNNTNKNEVHKIIKNLNVLKTCQCSSISTKITIFNTNLFSSFVYQHFNYCIIINEFPNELKQTNVIPVHKKNDKCGKCNYLPVGILVNISKIYERIIYNQLYECFNERTIYNQLYEYFNDKNIPSQCGFDKGYSSQHIVLVMKETK